MALRLRCLLGAHALGAPYLHESRLRVRCCECAYESPGMPLTSAPAITTPVSAVTRMRVAVEAWKRRWGVA